MAPQRRVLAKMRIAYVDRTCNKKPVFKKHKKQCWNKRLRIRKTWKFQIDSFSPPIGMVYKTAFT